MKILENISGVPEGTDWMSLGFNQATLDKLFMIMKNTSYKTGGIIRFGVKIRYRLRGEGSIKLEKFVRDPGTGIWVKFCMNFQTTENTHTVFENDHIHKMWNSLGATGNLLAINLGSNPDSFLNNLKNRSGTDFQNIWLNPDDSARRDFSGFTDCVYHRHIENVYGSLKLPDWRSEPGFLVQEGDDFRFIPFREVMGYIYKNYVKIYNQKENLNLTGDCMLLDIIDSLRTYYYLMVEGKDYGAHHSLISCRDLPHEDEIQKIGSAKNWIVNQELLTDLVVDWIRKKADFRYADYEWGKNFYKGIYQYMWEKNRAGFRDNSRLYLDPTHIDDDRQQVALTQVVLENFWKFAEMYMEEVTPAAGSYAAVRNDLIYREDMGKVDKDFLNPFILTKKKAIWSCYGSSDNFLEVETGNGVNKFYPLVTTKELKLALELIRTWVFSEWKKKNLIGEEFFLINKLKDSSPETVKGMELDLVVITNSLVILRTQKPYYIMKLVDKKNNDLYSIRVDVPRSGIKPLAQTVRGGINKYSLVLLAKVGDRVLLKGRISRVMKDSSLFIRSNRLKNMRGIHLIPQEDIPEC